MKELTYVKWSSGVGPCEHSNEPLDSIKGIEFLG